MASLLSLEAFDDKTPLDAGTTPEVQQSYEEGYVAGVAAAQQSQATLSAELVQCIADLKFSYSEARAEVLGALTPLLASVTETLLPHCVTSGFAHELGLTVHQAVASGITDTISIVVHPEQRNGVEAALAEHNLGADVEQDANLTPHAAWIKHGRTESYLDLDLLLSQVTEILRAIEFTEPRTQKHG